jgi:hypothetical protein
MLRDFCNLISLAVKVWWPFDALNSSRQDRKDAIRAGIHCSTRCLHLCILNVPNWNINCTIRTLSKALPLSMAHVRATTDCRRYTRIRCNHKLIYSWYSYFIHTRNRRKFQPTLRPFPLLSILLGLSLILSEHTFWKLFCFRLIHYFNGNGLLKERRSLKYRDFGNVYWNVF